MMVLMMYQTINANDTTVSGEAQGAISNVEFSASTDVDAFLAQFAPAEVAVAA